MQSYVLGPELDQHIFGGHFGGENMITVCEIPEVRRLLDATFRSSRENPLLRRQRVNKFQPALCKEKSFTTIEPIGFAAPP